MQLARRYNTISFRRGAARRNTTGITAPAARFNFEIRDAALSTMAGKLASRLGMDAGTDLMNTLKNTAFKGGNVTDEQFWHC